MVANKMGSDLQAVILAGGEGSKMFPLTEGIPKCLLPIANMPMIWYVVSYLQKSGIKDMIVITHSASTIQVKEALRGLFDDVSFDMVSLPPEEDLGTADALRLVKDKIRGDVLIASSDMITNIPLHCLIDLHRTYDASLTAMLAQRVDLPTDVEKKVDKKKPVDPNFGTRDLIVRDKDEGRLIYLSNEADLEQDNISFRKSTLKRYPHLRIETELADCHLYVMKKWLIDFLCSDDIFENLKSDFLPYVLKKQFSKPKTTIDPKDISFIEEEMSPKKTYKDIFSFCVGNEISNYMKDWSGYDGRCLEDQIKCHCYVSDDFCLRVNTLPAYTYMNREIHNKYKEAIDLPKDMLFGAEGITLGEKSHVGNDCLVGSLSKGGNQVVIKKTTIGKQCIIGSNVKISNCILMNNVQISDGCKMQNSIICEKSKINSNCVITNCQVSAEYTLMENSEVENEAIVNEEMEFEE